ncbi:MAG TPA: VOC family protein [Solirubrobacteraceae bacterium]|jgi:uncharacterized glyoxalase superfamily protein PhnB
MSETEKNNTTIVWPTLRYRDAVKAISFLIDAFGFQQTALHRSGEEGSIAHAELRWPGGGGIMLGSVRGDSSIAELQPGCGSIYIVTDQPDRIYESALKAGATVVREIREEEYGSRGFTVRDPEGVHWSFGTYAGS